MLINSISETGQAGYESGNPVQSAKNFQGQKESI